MRHDAPPRLQPAGLLQHPQMDVPGQLGPAARRRRRHPAPDRPPCGGADEWRGLPARLLHALQAAGEALADEQVPVRGPADARRLLHRGHAGVPVHGVPYGVACGVSAADGVVQRGV